MDRLAGALSMFAADGSSPNPWGGLIQLLPLFVMMYLIFWFLVIRPQRKQQRVRQEMLANLKKNDKVLTSGGIVGTILQVRETEVTLKIDDNCRVRLLRSAVTDVIRDKAEDEKKEQGD